MEISPEEYSFIEQMGLLFEGSGGSKTLGRVLGYMLLAEEPKNLDQIASDLIFSKATASLTIRQGLIAQLFEKVSIPGHRKDFYQVSMQSWSRMTQSKINILISWQKLIEYGLSLVPPQNQTSRGNLQAIKDYMDFIRWYMSDFDEYFDRWKKGEINGAAEG